METAELLAHNQRHYAASWFAQQAAEKALKALVLDRLDELPPRTHDLEFLGRQAEVSTDVQDELRVLNPAFGLARYPEANSGTAPVDEVTAEASTRHVSARRER